MQPRANGPVLMALALTNTPSYPNTNSFVIGRGVGPAAVLICGITHSLLPTDHKTPTLSHSLSLPLFISRLVSFPILGSVAGGSSALRQVTETADTTDTTDTLDHAGLPPPAMQHSSGSFSPRDSPGPGRQATGGMPIPTATSGDRSQGQVTKKRSKMMQSSLDLVFSCE
jgi:hypothetical protein